MVVERNNSMGKKTVGDMFTTRYDVIELGQTRLIADFNRSHILSNKDRDSDS